MYAVLKTTGLRLLPTAFVFAALMLLIAGPTHAATIDEIMAMQDAGVPNDVIIDVIDSTGLDDPLDADTIVWLVENDLDPEILGYLLENYYVESDEETGKDDYGYDPDDNDPYSNMRSGEGFHGGAGYNPLRDNDRDEYYRDNNYRDDNYRNDNYYRNYYYYQDYGYPVVYVYEPPVYLLYNHPYRAYRTPRYYNGNTGTWINGYYPDYYHSYHRHNHDHYWDNWYENRGWRGYSDGWFGDLYGDWYRNGRNHAWDLGGDLGWWGDDFRFRISF